jgi:hypothetical protein
MKSRYGWTANSKTIQRYVALALRNQANIDLTEFCEKLVSLVEKREKKSRNK